MDTTQEIDALITDELRPEETVLDSFLRAALSSVERWQQLNALRVERGHLRLFAEIAGSSTTIPITLPVDSSNHQELCTALEQQLFLDLVANVSKAVAAGGTFLTEVASEKEDQAHAEQSHPDRGEADSGGAP